MKRLFVVGFAVACVIIAAATYSWSRLPNESTVIARFNSLPDRASKADIADQILFHHGSIAYGTRSGVRDYAQQFDFTDSDLSKATSFIQTRIPVRQSTIFKEYLWACFLFDQADNLVSWKHWNWVVAF